MTYLPYLLKKKKKNTFRCLLRSTKSEIVVILKPIKRKSKIRHFHILSNVLHSVVSTPGLNHCWRRLSLSSVRYFLNFIQIVRVQFFDFLICGGKKRFWIHWIRLNLLDMVCVSCLWKNKQNKMYLECCTLLFIKWTWTQKNKNLMLLVIRIQNEQNHLHSSIYSIRDNLQKAR